MVSREGVIAVYIMASIRNGTLYVGVTSDLVKRIQDHRDGAQPGFTQRYGVKTLVWYEQHASIIEAIAHEKRLKKYPRRWKLNLIEAQNPDWADLYDSFVG